MLLTLAHVGLKRKVRASGRGGQEGICVFDLN